MVLAEGRWDNSCLSTKPPGSKSPETRDADMGVSVRGKPLKPPVQTKAKTREAESGSLEGVWGVWGN